MQLRRRVGMVFQQPDPVPDDVDLRQRGGGAAGARPAAPARARRRSVERALRQAALWDEVKDRLRASAMALSGGQQQRLCIARTIAPAPEVILLDEPTASLDPQGTQRIEELLFELKQHFTIVIVTHNMQQAARVSDTTTFFYLGTMVETGATRQIFTAPRERADRGLHHRDGSDDHRAPRASRASCPTPGPRSRPRPPAPAAGQRGAPAVDVRDFRFAYGRRAGAPGPDLRHRAQGGHRHHRARRAAASPPSSGRSTG